MPQHTAVDHTMTIATTEMILISDAVLPAVNAELRYYCEDPFAVQMLLSVDQSPAICWTFGRELLLNGVNVPTGLGDVQVYPTHDGVIIELRSGGAAAQLLAHTPDITAFTDRTLELVPLGSEMDHYVLDLGIASMPVPTRTKRDHFSLRHGPGNRGGGRPLTACADRQHPLAGVVTGPIEGLGSDFRLGAGGMTVKVVELQPV